MKEKDKEMANAVEEWQAHCVMLEKKNNELSSELDESMTSVVRSVDGADPEGSEEGRSTQVLLFCGVEYLCTNIMTSRLLRFNHRANN